MSGHLYIEGGSTGAGSKELNVRCREGVRKLLMRAGCERLPRLSVCGGRTGTFADFRTAHAQRKADAYVAMLVDSEEPMADVEKAWDHLKQRDRWERPTGATDEQVLLMTTCMETWIVSDQQTLREHFGHQLQENALPPLAGIENRSRHAVQDALYHATRNCKNSYGKGKRSFEIVGKLRPGVLSALSSFARAIRILKARL